MSILVVGDGPRDQKALPNLICRILETKVETRYDDWHEVRHLRGKGSIYERKLKYLTRRARADKLSALAIVVDTDRSPAREKVRQLRTGRDDDRQKNPPFPTALGEANPHFDVWLLDDPVAVRQALGLANDFDMPNAVKVDNPKDDISKLVETSPKDFSQVSEALGEIAQHVSSKRCVHRNRTGVAAFESDVLDEIRPAVS